MGIEQLRTKIYLKSTVTAGKIKRKVLKNNILNDGGIESFIQTDMAIH